MLPTDDAVAGRLQLSARDRDKIVQRFASTVKFPTVSAPEGFSLEPFHMMREYSTAAWPEVFSSLEMELHGGASILLKWEGNRTLEPVMLAAHQDVVPAGRSDNWTHDPFSGEVFQGRVWGRGTVDYKCGYSGMLEAVSLLLTRGYKPERTVYLAFGHDEEVGGLSGAQAITDSLIAREVVCSSVLDEGGYIYSDSDGGFTAELAVAEKGYASFRLVASAVQGHSSVPPQRTAIGTLAAGLVAIENSVFPRTEISGGISSSRWLATTAAPTVISGGYKENILPETAEATVNTRPSPGSSVSEVFSHIVKVVEPLGIVVELLDNASVSEPSEVSSVNTRDMTALRDVILKVIPEGTRFRTGVFPAATDSRRYSKVAQNTYRFMPVHLGNRGIGVLHSVDESISVADYLRCVEFYAGYIARVST
ncbi:MAG: M20/M25/M40 family metallo-hydrolase [Candidatus Fermentibacteraceae bacterium]|nr:M20/M25/M40 family metallo-hydrolase [Candidatus Fermentibacteraceae bacterium]